MNLKKVIANKGINSTNNTVLNQPVIDILFKVIEFCTIEDIFKLFVLNRDINQQILQLEEKANIEN